MPISARNQLPGTVTAIHTGEVMAEVEVAVGGSQVVSVITRRSVEDLGLRVGDAVTVVIDAVTVVIKSTEVMLSK